MHSNTFGGPARFPKPLRGETSRGRWDRKKEVEGKENERGGKGEKGRPIRFLVYGCL